MKHVDLWVTLDMERSVDQAIVRVPRLDNWRRIIVRLRVGDAPYELPAGAAAAWSLDRFGEGVPLNEIAATVSTMEVESGETEQVIVLQWDAAWTQISGAFRAIIHIVGSDQEDLWTPTFQFIVTESPYDDATVRQSPQFSALAQMKADLEEQIEGMEEVYGDVSLAVGRAETAAAGAEASATTATNAKTDANEYKQQAMNYADTASSAAGQAVSAKNSAEADAAAAAGAAEDAEAWAVGEKGGEAVPSTDPTYHNNAKYYAEQAAEQAALTTSSVRYVEQELTDSQKQQARLNIEAADASRIDNNSYTLKQTDFKKGYVASINSDYSINTTLSSTDGYLTTKFMHFLKKGDILFVDAYADGLDVSIARRDNYQADTQRIVYYAKVANGITISAQKDGYYYVTLRKKGHQIEASDFTGTVRITHNTEGINDLLGDSEKVVEIPCLIGSNVSISSGKLNFTSSAARARTDFFMIPEPYKYILVEPTAGYVYNLFKVSDITVNSNIPASNIDSWNSSGRITKVDNRNVYIIQVAARDTTSNVEAGVGIKLHMYRDVPMQEFTPIYSHMKKAQTDTILKDVANYKQNQGAACDDNGVLFLCIPNENGNNCTIMLFDTKTNSIIKEETFPQTAGTPIFGHMNDVAFRDGYWYVPYYNADSVAHSEVFKFSQDLSSYETVNFKNGGEDMSFVCWRFCYDKLTDRFYASYHNDYTFAIFDGGLNYEGELTLSSTTTLSGSSKTYMQGCETDGEYLYCCNTSHDFKTNYITVNRISTGELLGSIFVDLGYNNVTGTGDELESLSYDWITGSMYITYYVKVEGRDRGYCVQRVNIYSQPNIAKLLHRFG